MKSRSILLLARLSLFCIFLVIIAGSVVRMTGSGMGCPDWPKCYGYSIPPTSIEPLMFESGKQFGKGQMVILNDTLWVANETMTASVNFDRTLWHKYPKHNYAIFNATHTWIEYINRLATVLLGIPVMLLFGASVFRLIRKKDYYTFLWSGLALLMLGFEAWLGKVVVDGNLKEHSITYHMLGSLALVAFIIMVIIRHGNIARGKITPPVVKIVWTTLLVFSFIQVMMGTQVRERVDVVAKAGSERGTWIDQLPAIFLVHRSFSILVVILCAVLYLQSKKHNQPMAMVKILIAILGLEVAAGVGLNYFGMPAFLQPTHLFLGVVLFASSYYAVMGNKNFGQHTVNSNEV